MCYSKVHLLSSCHNVCLSCIRTPALLCPVCSKEMKFADLQDLKEISNFNWIYEGRNNGWWYYTPDIQRALDSAYETGKKTLTWFLRSCGQTITLNLEKMEQINPNTDGVRRIARLKDPSCYLIKGIGGVPFNLKNVNS
jgi:hypothetical protein